MIKRNFILILFFIFFLNKSLFAINYGAYLAGESALKNKENKIAISNFENAINSNEFKTNYGQEISEKLCILYLLEGRITDCILLAKKIEKNISSDSIEAQNILMVLVIGDIKKKNFSGALSRLKKIKKSSYERFSVPIIEAWLISENQKNLRMAKNKLDELEKDLAVNGLRYVNLALIHERFEKYDEALIYYQKSLNAFAQPSYRLVELSVNAFARKGDFEKAKDIYKKFLKGSNDYLLVEKGIEEVEREITPKKLIKNTDDAIAELFSTIASTFSSDFTNNFSIIYSHFSLYLKKDFEVANLYLAELLEENRKYQEANDLYKKIKPTSNFFWHSRLKKARNLELLGKSEEAILILKKMSDEEENRYDSLKLLGDIYRNHEEYSEAIKVYNKGVSRLQTISTEDWDLLYSRGIALERNNKWDLAEKDFLKILEIIPNQPDVLNYLGYSWIDKNINLEKAKEYVLKAVELRPRDPYISDSLGWAYYRLNEYDKAVKELERAVDLKPTDPIINDHLGDAYFKVNRKIEAFFQWEKAVRFKPEQELEKEIREKIKKYGNGNLNPL